MNLIEGPTEPNYQENEIKIKPGYSDPNLNSLFEKNQILTKYEFLDLQNFSKEQFWQF